jgi:hypothetical protein
VTETPQPAPSPFSSAARSVGGKVRKRSWPLTVDEAVRAAQEAGYTVTPRSTSTRAHVQKAWNNAATITPVPGGGVVVKPAWTTAQIVIVVGILVVLFLGFCALP